MSRPVTLRLWNNNPQPTGNFKVTTKMTTLGTSDTLKSIMGYYISLRQEHESNLDDTYEGSATFRVTFGYRTDINHPFTILDSIGNIYAIGSSSKSNIDKIITFDEPIQDILKVQLQVRSVTMNGKFSINDFGLLYRTVRSSSSETHDED
jgi:hypothetical protein